MQGYNVLFKDGTRIPLPASENAERAWYHAEGLAFERGKRIKGVYFGNTKVNKPKKLA